VDQLAAAGNDATALQQFIDQCGAECPNDLLNTARTRLVDVSQPPPAPVPPPKSYLSYDNHDVDGSNERSIRDTTVDGCESICTADSQCQAYTFDKWNKVCFLKTDVTALRLNPKSISKVLSSLGEPSFVSDEIAMMRYRSKIFPGSGYSTLTGSSFLSCESDCRSDVQCIAFTFMKNDRTCHLLDSTGEYFSNGRADSGVKTQSR
ncbi:PAN domain-containing protein, partial [Mesorhizobium sp. M0915]|uniref:PAN domain-containing protein n=1 Tax=Mesorhizobium sp. M0915 TaxID=2957027 RepID=UPI00333CE24A